MSPSRLRRRHLLGMPLLAGIALAGCASGGAQPTDDGGQGARPAGTGPAPAGSPPAVAPATPTPGAAADPVQLAGTRIADGWMVQFLLLEQARTIWYRRPGDPDWVETGNVYGARYPTTGEPVPRAWAIVGELSGTVPFSIRYLDQAGVMKGPFEVPFDTVAQAVAFTRNILTGVLPRWVHVDDATGKRLAYFTALLAYKHALREIRFGFDAAPMRQLRFTPSTKLGISEGDELYVEVPPGARACNVELVFTDGSSSGVRRFEL